jgi:hypothetical protein
MFYSYTSSSEIHDGAVGVARLPPGGDDVVRNQGLAGAGGEADGEGRLQRGAGAVPPHRAPRLLHRDPACVVVAALLELNAAQFAVAGLVLDEEGEVEGVGADVHSECDVHALPVARDPAMQRARCQLRSWTTAQTNKEKKETISLVETLLHAPPTYECVSNIFEHGRTS